MWVLHYKSNIGSFLEEKYETLAEMFEAMELLFEEEKIKSFRVRWEPKEKSA